MFFYCPGKCPGIIYMGTGGTGQKGLDGPARTCPCPPERLDGHLSRARARSAPLIKNNLFWNAPVQSF